MAMRNSIAAAAAEAAIAKQKHHQQQPPSGQLMTNPMIATASAIQLQLSSMKGQRKNNHEHDLTFRLQSNDPTLTCLRLAKESSKHFTDFARFLCALESNSTVRYVELTWRFLRSLTDVHRIMFMKQIGLLSNMENLQIEAIGPCSALVAALRGARDTIKILQVGSLGVANTEDIMEVAEEFSKLQVLERVSLSNISVKIEGRYRLDEHGDVWYDEINNEHRQLLSFDPLLLAMARVKSLEQIQLQLYLDSTRWNRIENDTLQQLLKNSNYLVLTGCQLDDEHCLVMAELLRSQSLNETKTNPSTSFLENLVLIDNERITQHGWSVLAKMLEHNYCLKTLVTKSHDPPIRLPHLTMVTMANNRIDNEYQISMDYHLKLNRAGRMALFGNDESTYQESVNFLLQGKEDVDILYYALRTNPCLYVPQFVNALNGE